MFVFAPAGEYSVAEVFNLLLCVLSLSSGVVAAVSVGAGRQICLVFGNGMWCLQGGDCGE